MVQRVVMTLILRVFVRSSCKILRGATLRVDTQTIRRAIRKKILRAAKGVVATRATTLRKKAAMREIQEAGLEAVLRTVRTTAHDRR